MRVGVLVLLSVLAGAHPARAVMFGFNDNGVAQEVVSAPDDARLLAGTGAGLHRMTFNWRYAEPTPGRFQFDLYDRIIAEDRKQGIRPVLILMYAPDWTWGPGITCPRDVQCPYPPDGRHLGAWRRIVTELVGRYPDMAALEIWNEPNLDVFFKPRADPKHYTRLVRAADRAVNRAGSDVPVLAGSLANAPATFGVPGLDAQAFLKGMYRAGAAGHFDGLSVHPYPVGNDLAPMFKTLTDVATLRDRYRDRAPIWVTEIGSTTTGQVSEEQQAQLLMRLMGILEARPGIAAVLLHTLVEPPFGTNGETGYGIVRRDGLPKPAYCALARLRLRSPSNCRLSVLSPAPDLAQDARWDAEVRVQAAVDAAVAHARANQGSLTSFETGTADPGPGAAPGPDADPSAVGIYRLKGATLLCAASRADSSYCAMRDHGRWSYGHATGTIGAAVQATIDGASRGW